MSNPNKVSIFKELFFVEFFSFFLFKNIKETAKVPSVILYRYIFEPLSLTVER